MNSSRASNTRTSPAPGGGRFRRASALALFGALLTVGQPARALDGCQVLLCLAAPSWRSIAQCVPTITQLFRDLTRGKPFPACGMSGPSNAAAHAWSDAPTFCPPQYTRVTSTEGAPVYSCDYMGAVTVTVNGAVFTRTWWSQDGRSSTEYSAVAKLQLGSWDSRFDDDYAAWLSAQPPVTPPGFLD